MVTIDLMSDIDCVTETFTLVLGNPVLIIWYLHHSFPGAADEQVS